MGPDQKIYVARYNKGFLGIIHNPDTIAPHCNFSLNGLSLDGRKVIYGLPSFVNRPQNQFALNFEALDLCEGKAARFLTNVVHADSLSWNFDDPSSGALNTSSIYSPSHTFTTSGKFSVQLIVYYRNNSDTIIQNLEIVKSPFINLGPDLQVCNFDSLELNAENENAKYLWNTNDTSPKIKILRSGKYWVKVLTGNCLASDTIVIEKKECAINLVMPNVFTPNGDGENDVFAPVEYNNIVQAELQIYNRWGRLVFSSNNIENGWDGKYNRNECATGVYYWILSYKDVDNNQKNQRGTVTLMR